jgi:hypothetical protein
MTAEFILLRPFHHSGSDRVQVYVPDQLGQVPIGLAKDRFVAPLKQMPGLLVFPIVKLAVCGQHALHNSAYGVVTHLNQQVKMIGHKAVGIKIEGESGFLLFEDCR